jgi:hypothetical protein
MSPATRERVLAGILSGELKPRFHNGVGFAQVYITPEVRLHVWHPDLPAEPEGFGCRHDHRFNFTSTVLVGAMTNLWLDYYEDSDGAFAIYRVQPAHLGAKLPEREDGDDLLDVVIRKIQVVRAGETYSFPKRVFHESRGHGTTVTCMRKFDQEDTWAGILAPIEQTPEHGMERCTIDDAALKHLVFQTLSGIPLDAWDHVQRMIDDDVR